jgi:tetratricopeptide (TPR) repeat protein
LKILKNPYLINILAFASILLLSFIFYGSSLKNKYNLDDNYVIVNQLLTNQGIKAIPDIFTSNYINKKQESHSYRPVTLSVFAMEYELFGAKPLISHFINVLLYGLCCFLVFRLVLHLRPDKNYLLLAFITAVIFLILPVHSEVVNNVKCRDELLSFAFALGACIQFLNYGRKKSYTYLMIGLVLLALSLLSKKSSLPLLAVIPIMTSMFTLARKRKIFTLTGIFIAFLIALRFLKSVLVENTTKVREIKFFENPLFDRSQYSFFDRIPAAIATVGEYIRLLIFPEELISYYGYNQVEIPTWSHFSVWVVLLLIAGLVVLLIKCWKDKPLVSFSILWFFITISMFSNLVKPVVGIIGERFAFLPSLGFALLIAVALHHLSTRSFFKRSIPRWGMVLTISLIAVFSCLKVNDRNADWYDFRTLVEHDVATASDSAKLHVLLANDLFREIRTENDFNKRIQLINRTLKLYERSVEIYPGYYKSWNNMGTLVLNEYSDYERAIKYYENAIFYKPDYKDALFGAGYANEVLGNKEQAINYYGQLMAIDPNHLNVAGRVLQLQSQ